MYRPEDAIPERRTAEELALQEAGRGKMLIKSLPFTVSLFPTVFFLSSTLYLVLNVPSDEATTFSLKSYL